LELAGFFERSASTWKVPFLYRDGFNITQGKGFDPSSDLDMQEIVVGQEFAKRWKALVAAVDAGNDPSLKRKLGPKAAIDQLIDLGFFKRPRTLRQIGQYIEQQIGVDFGPQPISGALARVKLSRSKTREGGKWAWYETQDRD
jgi:hypothetical protein